MPELRAVLFAVLGTFALVACGGGGGDGAEDEEPTPPPIPLAAPQLSFTAPGQSFELANYTLAARYDLRASADADFPGVASGITYNGDSDTLFVVSDRGGSVFQFRKDGGVPIDSLRFRQSEGEDSFLSRTKGIAHVSGAQFVVVEDRLRQATRFTYAASAALTPADVKTFKLGKDVANNGLDGVSYDPSTAGFVLVKRKNPLSIFQTTIDFDAGSASNGAPGADNSSNLFAPGRAGTSDFSDVWALSNALASTAADYPDLLVLSRESGQLLKMTRSGSIKSQLDVGQLPQHEGITTDRDGKLYLVNAAGGGVGRSQLWVYEPTIGTADVGADSRNLYLSFETPINPGSGSITISNGSDDVRTIARTDADQLSISGNVITLRLNEPLRPLATYTVQAPAALVKARPASSGRVSAEFGLSFTTRNETRPPMFTGSLPVDNTVAYTGDHIVLSFSESVKAGSGNIEIISSDGEDNRAIAIDDAAQVSITSNSVEVRPNPALRPGSRYSVQIASGVIVDLADNAFSGIAGADTLDFTMGVSGDQPETVLDPGDLLFVGINGDAPDAFAFILLRDIVAGTRIGFTDRDYNAATSSFPSNEAAFIWSADADYAAGTIVTIQVGSVLVADRGIAVGRNSGGISTEGETYYAFQGEISEAGRIDVARFLAAVNIKRAAGDIPEVLKEAGSYFHFEAENARCALRLDGSDIETLAVLVRNMSNWESQSVSGYAITDGSMFPPP